MFLFSCLIAITAFQTSNAAPEVSVATYHGYRCLAGPARPNAIINCITTLDLIRRDTGTAQSFLQRDWQDSPGSCQVFARRQDQRSRIVVHEDLPDNLIFALYRCYQTRNLPTVAGYIMAGPSLSYELEIIPPPEPPHIELPTANDISASLSDRGRTLCKKSPITVAGAYTDCLAALAQIYYGPQSSVPRLWAVGDNKTWRAPNCRVHLSFSGFESAEPDYFSERSLIADAVWVMGKCFAGPEGAKGYREGYLTVGTRREWTLTVRWG
ncbi:MAG: hypothetical protein Q9170_002170 [Blastenia crenularia]